MGTFLGNILGKTHVQIPIISKYCRSGPDQYTELWKSIEEATLAIGISAMKVCIASSFSFTTKYLGRVPS